MMSNFNRENKIRKDVANFYNIVAEQFSQTRKKWWDSLNFVKKYIYPKNKILDFGCGNGRLLEFIYGENLQVDYTGIDISKELIEIAKNKYQKEKFLVIKNENKTPFKNEQFDLITSIAVFHHFTPAMAERGLKEMKRIIKKNGVIVLTAWYLWNKKRLPYLWKSFWRGLFKLNFSKNGQLPFSYSDKKEGRKTYWRFCYWWSKKELENLAFKNGLEILESGYSRDKNNNKINIYLVCRKK